MLRQLHIKGFAIIDDLTIEFGPGLNVLTGETGAGKSIIVDALGLTLGERAQSDMVRTGWDETLAEALFEITSHPLLDKFGIAQGDCIILRRVLSQGKSRAYINNTMVNLQTLLEFGHTLVDIHGQHEHQSLLSTENQRALVDAYGRIVGERTEFENLFYEVQTMKNELSDLASNLREKEQKIDFLKYQIQEIDAAALRSGEKEALEEERRLLSNLSRLVELTGAAYALLYSGDGSVSEKLSSALSMMREVSRIDQGITEILASIESAKPLIDDASSSLRASRDRYDLDPGRLEEVEMRLDLIKRLERKYRQSVEGVLHYRDKAEDELQGLALSDERLRRIEDALHEKEKTLGEKAVLLSDRREKSSAKIEAAVKAGLKELAMAKADFTIDVRAASLSSTGTDSIEFLFSANGGEPPRSLSRTASGGELSRVMLALKETLAEVDKIPVLVFDEVDAGIGGRTAEHVGKRLKNLARKHQVFCITHLPQIASLADRHIVIEKIQKKGGVSVTVRVPSGREREEEIARMLSGNITEISLKHARELLDRAS